MILIKEIKSPYETTPAEDDQILAEGKTINEIPQLLADLGFSDCKTKLNENGTKLYYKGKRVL